MSRHPRLRRFAGLLAIGLTGALAAGVIPVGATDIETPFSVDPPNDPSAFGGFEQGGNQVDDPVNPATDWSATFASGLTRDVTDDDIRYVNAPEDDPASWTCTTESDRDPDRTNIERIYINERTDGGLFLDLAWVRQARNDGRSVDPAHIAFEINQQASDEPDGSDCALARTTGDLLVTWNATDYETADVHTTIHLYVWTGTAWIDPPAGIAQAGINDIEYWPGNQPITDYSRTPGDPTDQDVTDELTEGLFGEVTIDLQAAFSLPADDCGWEGFVNGRTRGVLAAPVGDTAVDPNIVAFDETDAEAADDRIPQQAVSVTTCPTDWALSITPAADSSSLVNTPQTYNVHLQKSFSGPLEDAAGETLTFALTGEGAISDVEPGAGLGSCVTPANGQCDVTIDSTTGGGAFLTASFDKSGITVSVPVSLDVSVTRHWVDYRLAITPSGPVQDVGEFQNIVVTLERSASPFVAAPGRTVELILTGVGTIVSVNGNPGNICVTDALGQCNVVVTSAVAGGTDITARFTAPEPGADPIYTALGVITWVPVYGNDPGVGGYGDDPYGYGNGGGDDDPDPFGNNPIVEPAANNNQNPNPQVGGEVLTQDPSVGTAGAGDPAGGTEATNPMVAGTELPRTGAHNPAGQSLMALGLIAAGLAAMQAGRRRSANR